MPVSTPDNVWWLCAWCPGGSPPRPGSGHQWAPCQSVVVLGGIMSHKCSVGFSSREHPSSSRICLHTLATWGQALSCTMRNPGSHCTSIKSDHHYEEFILVPNGRQDTVGYDMEVCATLQGFTSQTITDLAKPVMMDDVTGSTMSIMVSPDSFPLFTVAQCESSLICEVNGTPMVDLPILGFSCEWRSSCNVLGCEFRSP